MSCDIPWYIIILLWSLVFTICTNMYPAHLPSTLEAQVSWQDKDLPLALTVVLVSMSWHHQ